MIRSLSLFAILFLYQATGRAQLRTARVFTDHAVLQRDKPLPVWGWAKPDESLRVELNGQILKTRADTAGRWQVTFAAMPAGGPYRLIVKGKRDSIVLRDLLLGEVWLCSGQSNMEWPLRLAANAPAEIRAAQHPKIRHLKVDRSTAFEPQADLPEDNGGWEVCSPKTAAEFSAVAYFFALELQKKLGDIPIGLVNSTWGGSQVESWISREAMLGTDEFRGYAEAMPRDWATADAALRSRMLRYTLGPAAENPTDESAYTRPGYDPARWANGHAPGAWDWQGIWAYRGQGYMARSVELAADLAGRPATLFLAECDQPFEVFWNGVLIEKGHRKGIVSIKIPSKTLAAGKNTLMLRLSEPSGDEWWEMGLRGSGKDLYLEVDGDKIQLDGEGWKLMPAWSAPHRFAHLQNNLGTILYNAMIHPLQPLALRGALWYQGESNAVRAEQYRRAFPLLISDWRQKWGEPFPFFFVQLSSCGRNQSSNEGSNWAELREAQTLAEGQLPKVGMAVTTDIGEADDIHPRNKKDVGKRLAISALRIAYQQAAERGPHFRSVFLEEKSALLTFDFVGEGLLAQDKFGYLRGFEVAGEDRVFHYAQAQVVAADQIRVFHPEGKKPAAVRYAWSDAPTDANIFNRAGLPLGPFRTDDWPMRTRGVKFE
jgi:sialate O-acetylesterase